MVFEKLLRERNAILKSDIVDKIQLKVVTDQMIDVEEMAKNDIQEVLTATFEGAVYDQNESFVDELNKAIDNCKI